MSKVYESLKDVVPVTSNPFAQIKGTNAPLAVTVGKWAEK